MEGDKWGLWVGGWMGSIARWYGYTGALQDGIYSMEHSLRMESVGEDLQVSG